MKLGGMTAAINGTCIDTDEMVGAMTEQEKLHLVQQLAASLEKWRTLKEASANQEARQMTETREKP